MSLGAAGVIAILLIAALSAAGGAEGASAPVGSGPRQADALSAASAAADRAPGRELPAERSRTSRSYLTASGERVTRVFPASVNFKDAGGDWVPVDNTLVDAGGGAHRNRANGYVATLPADLSRPVRFAAAGRWVEFSLAGAMGAGTADGAVKRYPDVLPGVSVSYETQPDLLKERLILAGAESNSTFRYSVAASGGLTAREAGPRAIDWVDGDGDVQFRFAAPVMIDAGGRESRALRLSLSEGGIELRANRAWLEAPDRAFPVVVDPDVVYPSNGSTRFHGAIQECTLASADQANVNSCAGTTLKVGRDASRSYRALLKFDVTSVIPKSAVVLGATFGAHVESRTASSSMAVDLHRVSRSWTTAATWNRHDGTGTWTTPGGDFNSTATRTISLGAPGWFLWNGLQPVVENWVDRSVANDGLLLKGSASDPANVFSLTSTVGDAAKWPHLDVWWEHRTGGQSYYSMEKQGLSDRSSVAVNVGNGNLLYSHQDLSISGTGIDLDFTRTYNSLRGRDDEMGQGWSTTLGTAVCLTEYGQGDMAFHGPSGEVVLFKKDLSTGKFSPPPGIRADLVLESSGDHVLTYHESQLKLRFGASEHGDMTRVEDRNGNKLDVAYTTASSLASITDTRGQTVTAQHVGHYSITKLADWTGRDFDYGYNSARLTSVTDPDNATMAYRYNAAGKLDRITDLRGNHTDVGYDTSGRVSTLTRRTVSTTDTDPQTTFTYYANPDKTVVTNPRGKQTTYFYDSQLRVTKVVDARSIATNTTFTSRSFVDSYEPLGAGSGQVTMTYDGNDNVDLLTSATGGKTDPTYTTPTTVAGGKYLPDSVTAPSGSKTRYGYDAAGNTTSIRGVGKDANNNEVTLSEINLVIDQSTNKGRLEAARDPRHDPNAVPPFIAEWDYIYDGNTTDRLIQIDPPLTSTVLGSTFFEYDALSRIRKVTDGRGKWRTFTYDSYDRIDRIDFSDGSYVDHTWDRNGNLTQRKDSAAFAGATWTNVFDELNRATQETQPGSYVNKYSYDLNGNLTKVVDPQSTAGVTYTYDDVDQVKTITDPNGTAVTTFAYEASRNLRDTITYPNGVVTDESYDLGGRVQEIKHKYAGGTVFRGFTYVYGEPATGKDYDLRRKVTYQDGSFSEYGYDQMDRLTSALTKNAGGTVLDSRVYEYDKSSNRTKRIINGATTNASFDEANRITLHGGETFTYDTAGNTTNYGGRLFAYNDRGQTSSFTPLGGTAIAKSYMGPGQSELLSSAGDSLRQSVLGVGRVGNTYYTRSEDGMLIGTRCACGTARRYFHHDGLGSVVAMTDDAGAQSHNYVYDPYGNLTSVTEATTNQFRYAGGWQHAGIYHFGERLYEPGLGRWTQMDPLNQPSDLRQANRYMYVGGDPINNTDLSGQAMDCGDVSFATGTIATGLGAVSLGLAVSGVGGPGALVTGLGSAFAGFMSFGTGLGDRAGVC